MAKIELSEQEIKVIEAYKNGDIDPFTVIGEEQTTLKGIIQKAEEAYQDSDDDMDDLVLWYYDKFLEQNGEASPADSAE